MNQLDRETEADLYPHSAEYCEEHRILQSSADCHHGAFDSADGDAMCSQALVSAARRCGL
jgi:hypothetical protein